MNLEHPLSSVLGHTLVTSALTSALECDRLHHAYLFHGPEGVGKRLTALCFTQLLLCRDLRGAVACGICKSCIRIMRYRDGENEVFHPDLHHIRRIREGEKVAKEIKIQAIRDLQKSLSLKAFEGGRRVVLIEEVDRLGLSAANALLKTLEEPLEGIHFLLTTTSLNSVLPTIKSRAQSMRFASLSSAVLSELLRRAEMTLPEDEALSLIQLSGGSIGRASTLYHSGGLARAEEMITLGDRQGGPQDLLNALQAVTSLTEFSEDDLALWFHLMRSWYRDALVLLHSASIPLSFPAQRELTARRGHQLGFQRLQWRLNALNRSEWHLFKRIGSNRKLILESLLLYLAGFDEMTRAPLALE